MGGYFLEYAEEYEIDPVLFVAIAMHETGWGTSNAVVVHNNPGGLMDPKTNWQKVQTFYSLRDGIEAMAKNLSRLINEEGLVTINSLGSAYAPVGAENDPDGLNEHWVPRVSEYANDLGGLTMHCNVHGEVEIIGEKAWVVPHTKAISSSYGMRNGRLHKGIDIADVGINDTPIVSFMDGEVIQSGLDGTSMVSNRKLLEQGRTWGFGWYVTIDHGNGIVTRYAHLISPGAPVGTKVKAGELIGRVGSTGGSTGPHLHFEIIIDGEHIDPMLQLIEFYH